MHGRRITIGALAALAALPAGTALAATITGGPGNERLRGTNVADVIDGPTEATSYVWFGLGAAVAREGLGVRGDEGAFARGLARCETRLIRDDGRRASHLAALGEEDPPE